MTEIAIEVALRALKLVLATVVGAAVYWIATAFLGAVPGAESALLAWLVGAAVVLIVQSGVI